MRAWMAPLAVALATGCAHPVAAVHSARHAGASPEIAPAESLAPPPRDDGRLPSTAVPKGYSVALRVDPNRSRFSGVTTILVDVTEATSFLVLNARDMRITRAIARVGESDIAATSSMRAAHDASDLEELVLAFVRPLPTGPARIEITYDAPFAPDLAGLYRAEEEGARYAFSQFESTSARRAFPCFDEPEFKTPYDVTIIAPPEMIALSNNAEVSRAPLADGMVSHVFATTPPLPSYLIAFAVGPFDVVEGQKEPVPLRVITTRGRGRLARLAVDVAPALLDKLSDYFDMRYPFAKLDLIAVPDFAPGAMENPGLIMFRDALLLVAPDRTTVGARRTQAEVIAHELAHQWFGDLVTMKWWDDLWLNEGFATWAEAKVVDAWQPSFGARLGQIAGVQGVMDVDAMTSARAVRQPVRSTGEANEAFDGLTYDKGAALLRTLETWLGPDVFRRGIQRYLIGNAWKSARAEELFAALEYVSTQHVTELARGLLDKPGVPDVIAEMRCADGEERIDLRQSEWRPLGASPRPVRSWTVPVCVLADGRKGPSCFTLGEQPIRRSLGRGCASWIQPNAGLAGYYRFLLDPKDLVSLAAAGQTLEPADRLGVLSNAWAAVRQGSLDADVVLRILPMFDGDSNRYVVDQVVNTLYGVDRALVSDSAQDGFKRYVVARLKGRKRALGWASEATARSDDSELERRTILAAMGDLARDDATLAEAEGYAVRWLADSTSIPSDTAAAAVPLASIHAGAARLLELRTAARTAKLPQDRLIAVRAMGAFTDPTVLRAALDLTLTDELRLSEGRSVWGAAGDRPDRREVLLAWEKENWARLRERVKGGLAGPLIAVIGSACTREAADGSRAFFATATQGMPGVQRGLNEALEAADLCVALREHGARRVSEWLEHHHD